MPLPAKLLCPLLLLALPFLASGSARAAGALTLGGSFGVSALMADGSDVLLISIPNGNGVFASTPGFRFGHVSESRRFEFGFDASLLYLNSEGSSAHQVVFGLALERHLSSAGQMNFFFGGEAGLTSADLFAEYTQPYLGVAIGTRNVIAEDNGSVKFVLRYRHHFENEDDFVASYDEFNLGLAYSLWIPH